MNQPSMDAVGSSEESKTLTQAVRELQGMVQQMWAERRPPPPLVPAQSAASIPPELLVEPFVPFPERFSGTQAQYPHFKTDCELFFSLRPLMYARDFVRVRVAIILLAGKAKSWAHQLLRAKSPVLNTWTSFMSAMDSWVNRSQPPSGTRSASRSKRSLRYQEEDYNYAPPRPACVPVCPAPVSPPAVNPPEPPLEESPASLGDGPPALDSEEPMQLGATQVSQTAKEQVRRRRLGLCFYCGGSGHFISFCPIRPSHQLGVGYAFANPRTPPQLATKHQVCCCNCPCPGAVPKEPSTSPTLHASDQSLTPESRTLPRSAAPHLDDSGPGGSAPKTPQLERIPLAYEKASNAIEVSPVEVQKPEDTIALPPVVPRVGIAKAREEVDPHEVCIASNGTQVRREDLEVFEAALQRNLNDPYGEEFSSIDYCVLDGFQAWKTDSQAFEVAGRATAAHGKKKNRGKHR